MISMLVKFFHGKKRVEVFLLTWNFWNGDNHLAELGDVKTGFLESPKYKKS